MPFEFLAGLFLGAAGTLLIGAVWLWLTLKEVLALKAAIASLLKDSIEVIVEVLTTFSAVEGINNDE